MMATYCDWNYRNEDKTDTQSTKYFTYDITSLLDCIQFDEWEQISLKFESKHDGFCTKNAFENVVCKMVAIFFSASMC